MARLTITQGPNAGQEHVLSKDVTVLGRSFDADLRIDDLTVSRKHAKVIKSGEVYFVEDLGSGNGTRLNGKPITRAQLEDNDEIQVCQNVLVFRADGAKVKPEGSTTTVSIVDKGPEESAIINAIDVNKDLLSVVPSKTTGFDELFKMHKRFKLVFEVSNAIGTTLNETELLGQIMDRLFDVFTQADRGFIVLRDPETRRLVPKVARRRDGGNPSEITFSRTIISAVMNNKKAVLSSDAMGDDRFKGGASIVNFQIRSMMCVPLIAQDEILGILHVDTIRQAEHFTNDDLNLLATIANQAALSIANARMHTRLLHQQRMDQDLQFATRIQQSFLPQHAPVIEGFTFKNWYKAAQAVGGDFYDFIRLDKNRLGIVIGDVAGKGVPAALMMAKLSSDVRYYALTEPEPKTLLARLNDKLAEGQTEDIFVTLLYLTLIVDQKKMVICNAGHLPPVVRKGPSRQVKKVEGAVNYPLGVLPGATFEQEEYQLDSGDAVAIFTDGVIEAMDKDKNQYGFQRLEAAMAANLPDAGSLGQNVLEDVRRFVGNTPQSDDLTLVCFGAK